jgi:hypothetical protein
MTGWKRLLKSVAWRFEPVEYAFPDYLYEFTAPANGRVTS